MTYRLEFSLEAERDFGLIFDHLFDSYLGFGEPPEDALGHAEARILEIRAAADRIAVAPHRGRKHDNILPGLWHLTIRLAVYWFDVDDDRRTVRILAIFFGGQDHIRHMMARLLGG